MAAAAGDGGRCDGYYAKAGTDTGIDRGIDSPGIALILVNQTFSNATGYARRRGAEEDYNKLKNTFKQLGFQVMGFFNVTSVEIIRRVKEVQQACRSSHASLVVAISSHGEQHTVKAQLRNYDTVVGTDGGQVTFSMLVDPFMEANCPALARKPKLFFIQACRGDRLCETATALTETTITMAKCNLGNGSTPKDDSEVDHDGGRISRGPRPHIVYADDIPLQRDFLLACSTPPDFFAFHNMNGSWFIWELCDVLMERHETDDLNTILTEVNWRVATQHETRNASKPWVAQKRVMPWVASMLTKLVML